MKKRLTCFVLALLLLVPAAGFAEPLAGYDAKAGYTYVLFGSYPQTAAGGIEPILWRVLTSDDNETYLLSEYILEAGMLNSDNQHYNGWLESEMYTYLNTDFMAKAFTLSQQSILVTKADAGTVSLMSVDDMKDKTIGFGTNDSRLCKSTDYAKANGLFVYQGKGKYSPYWSRTRSDKTYAQRRVMDDGKLGYLAVTAKDMGVRPVIWLDTAQMVIASGSGSQNDPFVVTSSAEAEQAYLEEINATPVPTAEPTAAPTPAPTAEPAKADEGDKTDEMTEPVQAEETPAIPETIASAGVYATVPLASGTTPIPVPEVTVTSTFPPLTEEGYLPEGESEFMYADDKEGHWMYASQTLRIEIIRYQTTGKDKLRWFEAEVYSKDETFRCIANNPDKPNSLLAQNKIAKNNQTVLSTNGDYYIYRVGRDKETTGKYYIGVIVRNGVVKYDEVRPASWTTFPNLDTLAIYANGDMKVHEASDGVSGADMAADGAVDVLCFGPWLIRDGMINPNAYFYGQVDNPRTGIGMVEPGHYYSILIEGKTGKSNGTSIGWMTERLRDLGCTVAFNLDGGATSSMTFMGVEINECYMHSGSSATRTQNEVFGIGTSELVK